MANVYDYAHKLAKAIMDSEEYKHYKEMRETLYSDEKKQENG